MPGTTDISNIHVHFGAANYAVLVVYFLSMLFIGIWAGRRTKGAAGYFTAEGKVHHVLVGLSLLGTYLSSLTMMALPALSYGPADLTWTVQLPFLLVTALIITCFVLPRYRESGCLSVYEFLEQRIHVSSRLLAAVAFIVLSVGRMGLVLYLPALAFSIVAGAPIVPAIILMGIVVTIYTVLGGIKGVIWTDAIQVVIFIIGAVATLFFIFAPDVDFLAVAGQYHKFRTLDWRTDIAQVTTIWLVLQTLFETVRIYSTQQEMTQRYLTAESTKKANWSVWMSILGYIPLGYIFYFIGAALFVFYKAHPDPAVAALEGAKRLDSLYAYFVVTRMPAGLAGLVIAAFFAAAMSTISSSMNSCSAVCLEDFYKRFSATKKSDQHYLVVSKSLSLIWGILIIIMAILFMRISSAQVVWTKVMAVSTCGVLALMALAFLPFRVHRWSAVIGFIAGYVSLFLMMFFVQVHPTLAFVNAFPDGVAKDTGITFLLWPVIGNLVCFFVALAVNAVLPKGQEQGT